MIKAPSLNANMRTHKSRHEQHVAARKKNKLVRVFESQSKKKTIPYLLAISGLQDVQVSNLDFGDKTGKSFVNSKADYYVIYSMTLFNNPSNIKAGMPTQAKTRGFFGRTCLS